MEYDYRIGDLVLFKTNQFIAFNKPSGLPVQEDKTGDRSLSNLAEIYTKSKVHLVHRLDRPASGLVLFAQTESALRELNEQFRERLVLKTYLAVVGEAPPEPEGELVHYLRKDGRRNRTQALPEKTPGAKRGVLRYRLTGSIDNYHLLEIELQTGRHHQIRAQLAAIGCPIKGDVKYGFRRGNRDRSIHLHAWKLAFNHPVTGDRIELTAPPPADPVWEAFGFIPGAD